MGKHSEPSSRSGGRAALVALVAGLAVFAVLGAGVGTGLLTGPTGLKRAFAWVPGSSSSPTGTAPPVSDPATPDPMAGHAMPTTSSSATPAATPSSATASSATVASTPRGTGPASAALAACVRKQSAATSVVTAATAGAAHWNEHLMGQTDLEDGSRSLTDVMHDVWGPTRSAGPGDVTAFVSAEASYAALPGCVGVTAAPASPATARLTQCLRRQAFLDSYVAAASTMMTDWSGHLQAMARHTAGQVSSVAAQEDWLRRWQAAPQHLAPYAAAAAALTSAPVCTA